MKRRGRFKQWGLTALLLFAISAPLAWFVRHNENTVVVDAGAFKTFFIGDKTTVRVLSKALNQSPQAGRFELRYVVSRGSGKVFDCQVEYDRQSQQLSERSIRSGAKRQILYSGVTDAAIHKVAQGNGSLDRVKEHCTKFQDQPDHLSALKFRLFDR